MSTLPKNIDATVLTGATGQSGPLSLGRGIPVGLLIPSVWVAADITFLASIDGANFFDLFDNTGTEVRVVVGAVSRYIALDRTYFVGLVSIKLRSGTKAAPINQTADRAVILVVRENILISACASI